MAKYIDDEAACEEDMSGSESGSDSYEKDSFLASEDSDESVVKDKLMSPKAKAVPKKSDVKKMSKAVKEAKAKASKADKPDSKADKADKADPKAESKQPKITVFSNKTLDASRVPPKPLPVVKTTRRKAHDFRMIFTNGVLLRKFLEPAAHAVKKMRFVICVTPEFTGFKIECHDQAFTLADRGIFECDIDAPGDVNGEIFCVTAESFMEALVSSTLKETDLCITRYTDASDKITFESINNENDVRALYTCNLVDSSQVDSLDGIAIELGFHVNVLMSTLKELSLNAKRCCAPTLRFDLWQAVDLHDTAIVHSKMCIGFTGPNTSGSHDFYISTRKNVSKNASGESEVKWEPLQTSVGLEAMEDLVLEKRCSNEYDNKKLRMFLNHMECSWVLVHLCTDNTTQPLVLDCMLGGAHTKHTVIVAPKESAQVE